MDSFIGSAQNTVDSPAPWWLEFENAPGNPEKSEYYLGAYQEMHNHMRDPDVLQRTIHSGNNYSGSSLWNEMRRLDVSSFNSLYSDMFEPKYAVDNSLRYSVDVSGAYTEAREKAAKDIIEYMESKGILKKGEIDSIYLDKRLPKNVLGQTKRDGYSDDVSVSYLPKIFDRSYKDVRDPAISAAIKYIQARTLKHERIHEKMLERQDIADVARTLGEMGYSEKVFEGLLEGSAELETEESFYKAGDAVFGNKVHNESPYLKQLRALEKIDNEFEYSDGETVYRKARGFYEALAKGLLSKSVIDNFIGGIELKSDFMAGYRDSGTCGKCHEYR